MLRGRDRRLAPPTAARRPGRRDTAGVGGRGDARRRPARGPGSPGSAPAGRGAAAARPRADLALLDDGHEVPEVAQFDGHGNAQRQPSAPAQERGAPAGARSAGQSWRPDGAPTDQGAPGNGPVRPRARRRLRRRGDHGQRRDAVVGAVDGDVEHAVPCASRGGRARRGGRPGRDRDEPRRGASARRARRGGRRPRAGAGWCWRVSVSRVRGLTPRAYQAASPASSSGARPACCGARTAAARRRSPPPARRACAALTRPGAGRPRPAPRQLSEAAAPSPRAPGASSPCRPSSSPGPRIRARAGRTSCASP